MSDDLRALRNIIVSSIDTICDVCEQRKTPLPSLDVPIDPSEYGVQGIRNDPAISRSIRLIVAAATQLIATVQYPSTTAAVASCAYALTAALGVVEGANIAEILRGAGPLGLHLNDIASRSNTDPKKLGRILRYLSTQHWFKEISPDVYANNLLSSTLDTGKNMADGFNQDAKYENAKGMAAWIGTSADEFIKAGSYFVDTLVMDPLSKFSEEPTCAALHKALGFNGGIWDFYERPEEYKRRNRFAAAMTAMNNVHASLTALGFDWAGLPSGTIVVDVGGGLGHVSMEVAKAHPHLTIVIEDKELVIKQAKQSWNEKMPSHIYEGKIHFIAMDFFDPQPKLPGPVGIFLLRLITHDWPDKYITKILRRLRGAACKTTKLLIIDTVLQHTCATVQNKQEAPAPLLANMGAANLFAYSQDLVVFGGINTGERLEEGFREILSASGWQLEEIGWDSSGSIYGLPIVAVPADTEAPGGCV